jgi:hypothetical protein
MSRHIASPAYRGRSRCEMGSQRGSRRASELHTRTRRRDSHMRTRSGARARKDHVRLRRPAARKETGAQDRPANPDPPANGKAPRTWCVCQWPNEVHASALRPRQGGVCPPPSLQGASTLLQHTRTTVTTMTLTLDKTMVDALARYTGTVTRCPAGRASAPDAKERGQAQFQCVCGHAGTMPYPSLFKRLWRGRRRGKPLRLRCRRCGRLLR